MPGYGLRVTSGGAQVRDAEAGDAEGIARVHVDSWRETYAGVLDERFFTEEAFRRRKSFWERYLALDPRPGRLAVALDGETIAGFASAGESVGPDAEHGHPVARPVTLFSIYLMKAAHGSGAGQRLLDAVVGDAPAQLWVLKGNSRATAFYERNRFRFDGAEYIDPGDANLVELRMVR